MTQDPLPAQASLLMLKRGGQIMVRRVQATELEAVAALLCRSFYPETGIWAWLVPILRLGIHQDLRARFAGHPSQYACFVGVLCQGNDRRVVGTVELSLRSLTPWCLSPAVPYISNLAVEPSARRQGVGQQLLAECEQTVRKWGQEALYLHVLANNVGAQQLYRKAGYQASATGPPELLSLFRFSCRLLLKKECHKHGLG